MRNRQRNAASGTLVAAGILVAAVCAAHAGAAPLDDILKRRELVICAHADALPFSRQGAPDGFQIELGRALAAELGVALRVQFMRLHREPRRRECDALISVAVPKNADADTDYRVSDAYMAYRPVLVVAQGRPPIDALADLSGGPVAVQSGSWAHFHMTQHDIPVWVRFRTDQDIIEAVVSGQAQAGIVSNFGYDWYRHGRPQAAVREAAEFPFDDDFGYDVAIGLMDSDQALLDRVNAALVRLRDRGIIAATLGRYGIRVDPPIGSARGALR